MLALRHGCTVERSWVAGTLWPDSPRGPALANLRNSLTDLRQALGPEADRLHSPTSPTLCLALAGAAVDVVAFDQAVRVGDAPALETAMALYRGPLLEGWSEEWVFEERQARLEAYLTALETLAARALMGGDSAAAARHLRRAVAADPLRETAQRALIQSLAASGNYAAAMLAYRELRLLLPREINTEPDVETQALFERVRAEARRRAAEPPGGRGQGPGVSKVQRQDPDAGALSSVGADPRPLTHHPLRGYPPAARVTACHPEALPHNLLLQLTSFIGREDQMAEVQQLLVSHRLVTLTGAGGCGKTRLALQAGEAALWPRSGQEVPAQRAGTHEVGGGPGPGAELRESFPDGVWLVELAPLADPALVPRAVATALGMQEPPGRSLTQTLIDSLKARQLLLLLDNCEHLVGACAQLAETLLRSCPKLRILATSREALGIGGETPYRVPSLSLPEAGPLPALERLLQYEAIRLFSERAVTALPTFRVTAANAPAVAGVCRRLDGIPLAIELAAARMKALPVEKLNDRLDDMFRLLTGGSRTALPRQQTLRATIDWSYGLLSEPQQVLLRRLAVFAGGWALEAAESVCADSGLRITDENVLDLLTSLVGKSLVIYEEHGGQERYRFLETVRQYAHDRLLEAGEAQALRAQHVRYFLSLAETGHAAAERLANPAGEAWRFAEVEEENFRAALEWCKTQCEVADPPPKESAPSEATQGLRLIRSLWWPWFLRSQVRETREYLKFFLSHGSEAAVGARVRAEALNGAGFLAYHQGEYAEARAFLEQSLALREALTDPEIGSVLHNLANVMMSLGDYARSRHLHQRALAVRRQSGQKWGVGWSLLGLAELARRESSYGEAAALQEEALDLFREIGDHGAIAWALNELGRTCLASGDLASAHWHLAESLRLRRASADRIAVIESLEALASLRLLEGQRERAAQLLGAAEGLRRAVGTALLGVTAGEHERVVAALREALGDEVFARRMEEGRAMMMEAAISYALEEADSA